MQKFIRSRCTNAAYEQDRSRFISMVGRYYSLDLPDLATHPSPPLVHLAPGRCATWGLPAQKIRQTACCENSKRMVNAVVVHMVYCQDQPESTAPLSVCSTIVILPDVIGLRLGNVQSADPRGVVVVRGKQVISYWTCADQYYLSRTCSCT